MGATARSAAINYAASNINGTKGRQEFILMALSVHQGTLTSMLYGITGNETTANDLYQDTAVYAVQHASSMKDKGRVYQWLSGIAVKLGNQHNIKSSKHEFSQLDSVPGWTEMPAFQTHSSPLEVLLGYERQAQISSAFEKLEPVGRDILFHVADGLSIDETATKLGITPVLAKQRYDAAKRDLSQRLQY